MAQLDPHKVMLKAQHPLLSRITLGVDTGESRFWGVEPRRRKTLPRDGGR